MYQDDHYLLLTLLAHDCQLSDINTCRKLSKKHHKIENLKGVSYE